MSTAQIHIPGYVVGTWDIDPLHTEVGFSVRHLMVSKVRGRFTRFEGSFVTAPELGDSSASATIDMTSIDTNNPTRDDDLRSKNFFEVDQYPQMTYRSTGLRLDGEQFILDGELTAHGVTRQVPLFARAGEDVHRALHSAVPTPHEEQVGAVGQGRARRLGHLPALRDLVPRDIQLAPTLELRAEFGQPAPHGLLRVREHGDLHRRPFM